MSSWSVTIEFQTGSDLVFAVTDLDKAMPVIEPEISFEYDTSEPPELARVIERWSFSDAYYLANVDTETMFDAFKSQVIDALSDPSDQVTGVVLKLDATEKWAIRTSSHNEVKISGLNVAGLEEAGGASFIRFSFGVEGVKHVSATSIELAYSYGSANGFENRTLTATVTTPSGASARSAAESAALLSLPSSRWRYITSGRDERVDSDTNGADTKATAKCTIQEQGLALAYGTNEYTRETVTETTADGTKVTLTVNAQGPSAESAVRAQEPSSVSRKTIRYNEALQSATAVYITEEAAEDSPDQVTRRDRNFSLSGGGRPRVDTPISGLGVSWTTFGARRALILQETYTVRARGAAALEDILFDRLAFPDRFDANRSSETTPRRVSATASAESDEWERTATRFYVFSDGEIPSPASLFELSLAAASKAGVLQRRADFEVERHGFGAGG